MDPVRLCKLTPLSKLDAPEDIDTAEEQAANLAEAVEQAGDERDKEVLVLKQKLKHCQVTNRSLEIQNLKLEGSVHDLEEQLQEAQMALQVAKELAESTRKAHAEQLTQQLGVLEVQLKAEKAKQRSDAELHAKAVVREQELERVLERTIALEREQNEAHEKRAARLQQELREAQSTRTEMASMMKHNQFGFPNTRERRLVEQRLGRAIMLLLVYALQGRQRTNVRQKVTCHTYT